MDATAKLIAIVALIAFAIERIRTGATLLIEAEEKIRGLKPAEAAASERRKILLVTLGAALTLVAVDILDLRIMALMQSIKRWTVLDRADYWVTWLVIFAGADRVREFLQGGKPAAKKEETPVVRLTLDNKVSELKQVS